jgi:hypothetical protein
LPAFGTLARSSRRASGPAPLLVLLLCIVAAASATACALDPSPSASVAGAYEQPSDAFARTEASIAQPGMAFHVFAKIDTTQGPRHFTGHEESWVDAATASARSEVTTEFGVTAETYRTAASIVRGGSWYLRPAEGPARLRRAPTCRGTDDAALALILACRGALTRSTTITRSGQTWDGRPAVAVITAGVEPGPGEITSFTDTLYLNATSYLPMALVTDGTVTSDGVTVPLYVVTRYEAALVPLASLPADLFSPASIGYVERDPEQPLQDSEARIAVAWLGRTWEPAGGRPSLALRSALVLDDPVRRLTGYRLALEYAPLDDPFAPAALSIEEWDRAVWDAAGVHADSGSAVAYVGDTVVVITSPPASPYASPDALDVVVKALVVRT